MQTELTKIANDLQRREGGSRRWALHAAQRVLDAQERADKATWVFELSDYHFDPVPIMPRAERDRLVLLWDSPSLTPAERVEHDALERKIRYRAARERSDLGC